MAILDNYKRFPSPSQASRVGSFWLFAKLDVSKWYTEQASSTVMAAGDDFRILKVRDKWVIRDSYWRIISAFDATTSIDIGTAVGGNQILSAQTTVTASDWAQGAIDSDDNTAPLTADGYIWVELNTATPTTGIIEVMIEMVAGPDETEL